jgi:hypothetical protein
VHPYYGFAEGMSASGNRIAIAEGELGLEVFEIGECEAFFFDGFESGDASAWSASGGLRAR